MSGLLGKAAPRQAEGQAMSVTGLVCPPRFTLGIPMATVLEMGLGTQAGPEEFDA